jgi:magnesium transporter
MLREGGAYHKLPVNGWYLPLAEETQWAFNAFSTGAPATMSRQSRRRRSHRPPPGSTPGTLVVDPSQPAPQMRLIAYGPDVFEERAITTAAELTEPLGSDKFRVVWLDVDGLGDAAVIEAIGQVVGLHRLSLADVVNTAQRPKVEDFGTYLFAVVKMPVVAEGCDLDTEQVSIVLGRNFVLTFQERFKPGDCFGPVRDRIRQSKGKIRSRGPDYLAYAIIDASVDAYFPILEDMGERLDAMEENVLEGLDRSAMQHLHRVRRQFLTVRRATWPLREAVAVLHREQFPLIADETRLYFRDCYDHTVQIIDLLETHRELGAGLMEVYLSTVSNRMNEIMKVLTIITTIFIPLTFIAGIYGMNFSPDAGPLNMPELRWKYGYVTVLAVMLLIAIIMVIAFRRRGWIGNQPRRK